MSNWLEDIDKKAVTVVFNTILTDSD